MRDRGTGGAAHPELPLIYEIVDLDTLRTIADPLRVRIFEQLVPKPRSIKEVAAQLGLSPGRLYYHVGQLEERGLIRVVDQHLVGNLVEKAYRAVASELEVAPDLLSFDTPTGKENINTFLVAALDATREDLVRSLEARTYALEMGAAERERSTIVTRRVGRLPEGRAAELQKRVKALLADFDASSVEESWDADEAHTYAFTVALYPHFDYPADEVDGATADGRRDAED